MSNNIQFSQEYPWLAELLQYEWLELYLDTLEITKQYIEAPIWQLKTQVWVLVYQYPVYRWALNQTELEQAPSAIMVLAEFSLIKSL